MPVANALRRPNRQVRPEPYGLPGVRGGLVPGGHRSGPTEAATETSPCLPLLQKRGDGCPPLGVAQSWSQSHPALKHRRRFRQRAAGAWGGFQAGLWKSSAGRGPAQETPDEGFLRETVRWTVSLFSCVCRRRLRPRDAVSRSASLLKKA